MRKLTGVLAILLAITILAFNISAQRVRLRSQITPACSSGSSLWKFADIYADGNIAVQGSYNCRGAFIYDISNPDAPTLASWYNPGNNQQFLEAIVIGNRGYFGSGNSGGVHIVDLSNPSSPQLLGIVNSTNGNAFNSIHEMMVIDQNGQRYLIENFNGFSNKLLKVINVTNPASPVFVRDINPTESVWVHAMHIRGNRMFTSGWGSSTSRGRTEIYDITNIGTQAPTLLGFVEDTTSTTAGNQMHSSWTSENGNYLYSAREITNSNGPNPGDIRTYDISNPAQPVLIDSQSMSTLKLNAITPHNPVVMGNKLYVSWYQAGLQVFDIGNPTQPKRIGQYDSFQQTFVPEDTNALTNEPWDLICGSENLQNVLPTSYDGNWAVFPFLGEDKVLLGDMTNGLLIVDVTKANQLPKNVVSDFDGDGKTDYSTYSPNGGLWKVERSSDNSAFQTGFGIAEDKVTTGDYDGDGKSDISVWRPSDGVWYRLNSGNGTFFAAQFGLNGDVPVEGDYDADGKTDIAVWRPSNGVWYISQSTLGIKIVQFGLNGDRAFTGDYEGDGKTDLAIYRLSSNVWYISQSSSSLPIIVKWGIAEDKPLVADFDGDAIDDISVYRPSEGNWYVLNSINGQLSVYRFGIAEDIPIPSDYDGDGKADLAVFRPSSNTWYRLDSSNGAFSERVFGQTGDVLSPNSIQP